MEATHIVLALLCGGLVGFTLGLIGGGGSIMATPLLLYVVGLPPHVAIGTGALSVSANALFNFAGHARCGHVRWRSAGIFAAVGAVGALLGSTVGKQFDGQRLLFLFALLMVVVGTSMLRARPRSSGTAGCAEPGFATELPMVSGVALAVGLLSGFFGIGGGFLIVPGLLLSTRMPMIFAVGSSLLAVASFGVATAANDAVSGLVDWGVAGLYIGGGAMGGLVGLRLATALASHQALFCRVFSGVIFAVAAYMLVRTAASFGMA